MASLVREAAVKDKELELFAAKILKDNKLDSHSDSLDVADALFRYCQTLSYVYDPAGSFDSVQSARQVIAEGKGDCDDLSVLLATLLALVGFKPRFVMARYKEDSEGYDHVYVDLQLSQGRIALDPSTRRQGIGWESPRALERVAYPIFDGKVIGLGEVATKIRSLFLRPQAATVGCRTAAGNVLRAPGGVSLSFPAVLFSIGIVFGAVKLADKVFASERWY